jgi:hypothetical protein
MAHTVVVKKDKEPESTPLSHLVVILPLAAVVQFFVDLPFDNAGHWIAAFILCGIAFLALVLTGAQDE